MEKQVVDRLTLENLISTTSTESLAKVYILNCRSEGKSPKTIAIYENFLKTFTWYCKQNNFPEAPQLTPVHVRHFFWSLSTESNRWGSNNPAARKPASQTTVSDYYRAPFSFFSWLTREQLISINP
jgi:site-specific recombinase XerD